MILRKDDGRNDSWWLLQLDARTEETATYKELRTNIAKCALWLQEQGIKPDDIVSVCTHNHLNSVVPCLATTCINAVFNPWDEDMNLRESFRNHLVRPDHRYVHSAVWSDAFSLLNYFPTIARDGALLIWTKAFYWSDWKSLLSVFRRLKWLANWLFNCWNSEKSSPSCCYLCSKAPVWTRFLWVSVIDLSRESEDALPDALISAKTGRNTLFFSREIDVSQRPRCTWCSWPSRR